MAFVGVSGAGVYHAHLPRPRIEGSGLSAAAPSNHRQISRCSRNGPLFRRALC